MSLINLNKLCNTIIGLFKPSNQGIKLSELSEDGIYAKIKELNLAPNISVEDTAYTIFNIAKSGIRIINRYWQYSNDLSSDGELEALILSSALIVNFKEEYSNTINLDNLDDRIFLLLCDEINNSVDNPISFINSRLKLYQEFNAGLEHISRGILCKIYFFLYTKPLGDIPNDLPSKDCYLYDTFFRNLLIETRNTLFQLKSHI